VGSGATQLTPKLDWPGEDQTTKGVRQRRFDVHREGRVAPGLLWTPEGAEGARPLALLGHGAANTKRHDYVVALARRLVRHHGFAAAAIDGPVHGDRRRDGGSDTALMFVEFAQLWANDPGMADEMVADWVATLDLLRQLPDVGEGPTGWWGLSMGTIIGIPVVAAEPRISVAVFGLMGTRAPNPVFTERFLSDARSIRCPVMFLLQMDDELMRKEDVFALFSEIGSTDKRLHAYPGAHVGVPAEGFDATEAFLARNLAPATG
jgi:dienelactone hydrolase